MFCVISPPESVHYILYAFNFLENPSLQSNIVEYIIQIWVTYFESALI